MAQPARGRPLQADYEELHIAKRTGRRERVSATLFRDGSGRTRIDWFMEAEATPATVSAIYDPHRSIQYFIDGSGNELF